jgi:hypothetical protein
MLKFNSAWRFAPPADHVTIPRRVLSDLMGLVNRIATQGDRWDILETFKTYFANAAGISDNRSSSESWAETDLWGLMDEAAKNPPMFIEAFYDACEVLRQNDVAVPDVGRINDVLAEHDVAYRIEPPNLTPVDHGSDVVIEVPKRPPTLAEQAIELYQQSLQRSEELLATRGRDREAVQEILWLLEM